MPRQARLDSPGTLHHVIICGIEKNNIVDDKYNIHYRHQGHLFQNQYKSIVCDEDAYFQELVRYIHLNPLRAKIVKICLRLIGILGVVSGCFFSKKQ